jgi:hypothetical protein
VTDNEKAAGMLDTSTTASKSQCTASVPVAEKNSNTDVKEFATLQARFARLGRELTRCHRAHDGRVTFAVTRWGESRYFSSLGDVQMHLHTVRRASHG